LILIGQFIIFNGFLDSALKNTKQYFKYIENISKMCIECEINTRSCAIGLIFFKELNLMIDLVKPPE